MPVSSLLHIFRTIKERGPISRTDLQHATNLSWGTITNTTRQLLTRKLILEQGARATKAGRKPMQLALNTSHHGLIGLEITPAHIHGLLMNLAGEILWHESAPLASGQSPDSALALAADLVRRAQLSAHGLVPLGIGLAMPAPFDFHRRAMRCHASMSAWNGLPIHDLLQAQLNLPLRLEQHANCLALAERWFGDADHNGHAAGPGENFICIHLGDTIDLGIVIAGEIYRGTAGLAGNFGHVLLDPNGPPCPCGDRGCVETYCTAAAVLRNAHAADPHIPPTHSINQLAELAAAGNPHARAAFENMGTHLGLGIANLIHLFDPALIILAGPSTAAAPFFQPALDRALSAHARRDPHDAPPCPVLISRLTHHAPAMGACGMILQSAFDLDHTPPVPQPVTLPA